jgi:hypothetical protein
VDLYRFAMPIRKQILISEEVDARLRRLTDERGLSQSALIAEAIRALPDASEQVSRLLAFARSIHGGSERLSERSTNSSTVPFPRAEVCNAGRRPECLPALSRDDRLAERVGFEPTKRLPAYGISSAAP